MILLALPALAAAIYYLLALVAAMRWDHQAATGAPPSGGDCVPISILKPVHGRDPRFYEAIRSHATQEYPEYEILFGVSDPRDPAIADIRQLMQEFPGRSIRLIVTDPRTANRKVGVLEELAAAARYPWLVVNDSDIVVAPDYLSDVARPLEDPRVGVVTCLYRARAESRPAQWEAIGLATEFMPSVLVARLIGVSEFVLGSTMVFRAAHLRKIGGFAKLGEFLADDYQLGKRITDLGYHVAFARTVVETNLGAESWREAWRHQVRWARTIRVSRTGGYYGYVVTQATFWALVAMAAGAWRLGLATLFIRLASGLHVGVKTLGDRALLRQFWLIPLRDLWGFAIWLAGGFGESVEWRGETLTLTPDGRIQREANPQAAAARAQL
ncbi:MAG TPA: bacteriohopanetetrol glucosamine biosynthesis glycosyltransferase HpnI [Bryobacteraceae bacterium]|nr:bacteriohopanetetrol glucosamine biosynthesis glycosyltransferase HpnI [Bryobacteraceae bacterium]